MAPWELQKLGLRIAASLITLMAMLYFDVAGSFAILPQREATNVMPNDAQSHPALASGTGVGGVLLQVKLVETAPWEELLRLDVGDTADRDIRPVSDARQFEGVMICAEKNTVRIRRAEVKLSNGRWQRLFVPLALKPGSCSKPIELLRGPRKIRGFQFDYEAVSAGYGRGIVVVKGQP